MSDLVTTFDAVIRDAILQSTTIFLIGLVVARYLVRRPARVHAVLVLAFVAAIVAPMATEAVRRCGWGLLPSDQALVVQQSTEVAIPSATPSDKSGNSQSFPTTVRAVETQADPMAVDRLSEAAADTVTLPLGQSQPRLARAMPALVAPDTTIESNTTRGAVFALLSAAWLAATLVLVGRLLRGVVGGRGLLATAEPCPEPTVIAALTAARERLNLRNTPVDVYQTDAVRCPMIWCWGGRPRLLLPTIAARDWSAATWTPILCHELAHWKRRDHWAALAAELVCCLMPWQVLGWWAKRRLEHASEQACDDWTLAAGHSAVDYAETLLGLVAQADPPLALAALRRRSSLRGRIQHILSQAVPHPGLGRLWGVGVLVLAVTAVGTIAMCQRGVARAEAPPAVAPTPAPKEASQPVEKTAKPAEIAPAKPGGAMLGPTGTFGTATPGGRPTPPVGPQDAPDHPEHMRATGKVLTADGKPVEGADLYWEVRDRMLNGQVGWPGVRTIATTKTGADGQFILEADFIRKTVDSNGLVIRAAGYGVQGSATLVDLSRLKGPIEVRLEPSAPIEGSVFTPNGEPVANARVVVTVINRGGNVKEEYNGWYLGLTAEETKSEQPRAYWPAAVVTDAQGKFRITDAIPSRAVADLLVQAPDFAATRVSVAHPDSIKNPGYDSQAPYRESNFTLVLETPLVVDGRFLDEKTGEPVAGTRLEVTPYSNGRGGANVDMLDATSDADGRYTLRLGSASMYFIKVFPPAPYSGIQNSLSARQIEQQAAPDRKLKYDIKLRRGITLKGRVVDAQTGDGVSQVQVVYQLERGRKLGVNGTYFPVTTDADGGFDVTAADGKGFLLVDAPEKGFYRLAVHDPRVRRNREGIYPNGILEVDVPSQGQSEPFVISLNRGPELVLRALSPDGKPVKKLRAACAESNFEGYFSSQDSQDGMFRIDAAQAGRKYSVYLFSEDAKAGTVAEVEAPADGKPIDVTLQPCATVRGRYIYDGGAPAPEISNFTRFRMHRDKEPEGNALLNLPFYDNFSGHQHTKRVTDADGNFELDGIVPGVFIYLNLNNAFANGERNYEIGVSKPGEVKELGDITIHASR